MKQAPLRRGVERHWPTPIFRRQRHRAAAVNRRLAEIVLERATYRAARSLTTIGGFRTDSNLLRVDDPAITALAGWISEAVEALSSAVQADFAPHRDAVVAEAWGNIYHDGDFQLPHIHHGAIWSGVYYVTAGGPSRRPGTGGDLELIDPRPVAGTGDGAPGHLCQIAPRAGLMIAFPSWLPHAVTPNVSSSVRISIAFNVGLQGR